MRSNLLPALLIVSFAAFVSYQFYRLPHTDNFIYIATALSLGAGLFVITNRRPAQLAKIIALFISPAGLYVSLQKALLYAMSRQYGYITLDMRWHLTQIGLLVCLGIFLYCAISLFQDVVRKYR